MHDRASSRRSPGSSQLARAPVRTRRVPRRPLLPPRRPRGRAGRARRRSSPSSRRGSRRRSSGGVEWLRERRAPLRRPELGGRGRAGRRRRRRGARADRAASRTSTSGSTATRLEPGSPVEIRALRLAALGPSSAARVLARARAATGAPAGTPGRRLRAAPRHARGAGPRPAPRSTAEPVAGPLLDRRVRHDRRRPAGLDRARATRPPTRSCCSAVDGRADGRRPRGADRGAARRATRSRRSPTRWRRRSSAPRTRPSSATPWTSRPRSATRRARRSRRRVTIPLQLGSIPHAMATLLAKWGDELAARRRLRDERPVRRRRSTRRTSSSSSPSSSTSTLIGFATTIAHHGDVGGRLPGSSACDNTEIFQEGLRLPWLRLYDARRAGRDALRGDPRERAHPAR